MIRIARNTPIAALLLLVACGGIPGEAGEAWSAWSERLAPEEQEGLLDFINDQEHTIFWLLDTECGLRSDAARNLVDYRDGKDGLTYTEDDDLFDTIEEIDDVRMVGPWTMDRLFECALARGYIDQSPSCDLEQHLTYLTDELPPALEALVVGELLQLAESRRDAEVRYQVIFAEVATYSRCGEVESFEVKYRQWLDPEGGVQAWYVIELAPSYDVLGFKIYI